MADTIILDVLLKAAGASLGYQYDPAGNVTAITNADGFTLHMDYDPSQRLVKASNEQGNAVTRTLDLDGKPRERGARAGAQIRRLGGGCSDFRSLLRFLESITKLPS